MSVGVFVLFFKQSLKLKGWNLVLASPVFALKFFPGAPVPVVGSPVIRNLAAFVGNPGVKVSCRFVLVLS